MEDPLLALLYRLNENQMALGMAIEELTAWVVDRGSENVGKAVEQHMMTLDEQHLALGEQVDAVTGELLDADVDQQRILVLNRRLHRTAARRDG